MARCDMVFTNVGAPSQTEVSLNVETFSLEGSFDHSPSISDVMRGQRRAWRR